MENAVSGPSIGCNAASAEVTDGLDDIIVKDTLGTHLVHQVGGVGNIALVVLLVLTSTTAVVVRLQRRPYECLREPKDFQEDGGESEPDQGLLV